MTTTNLDRLPPQSLEAEMAVLGSMLIDAEAIAKAIDWVREKDFYRPAHRRIFSALLKLFEGQEGVDVVTVGEELKRNQVLEEVGGISYLTELIHSVSTAAHVEHYAKIVREKSVLRDLIAASTRIVTQCYEGSQEVPRLLDEAEAAIYSIAERQTFHGFQTTSKLTHEIIEYIEMLHQRKVHVTGVPTGFVEFDKITSGFQKSDFIILAARPSVGKTALALNIASHVGIDVGMPVAIFSLEMGAQAVLLRMLCSRARANLHKVRSGYLEARFWTRLTNAAVSISEAPIFVDDTPGLSVLELRSRCRRLCADLKSQGKELALVIVDYLQLLRGASLRSESRQQEVSEISRSLKNMARDLHLPVVALSQLSRRPEEKGRDGRPQLADLRESGALEQDSDLVSFIYREFVYKPSDLELESKAELIVAKQRNGPTGSIPLSFLKDWASFENFSSQPDVPEPVSQQPVA
ncbi:MAG: replicative DNA helicase [Elusimicrobia bacterium]|nr:replicative DNA helicase [Elusimicrobiota bacterium]